jgi:hypothetical protein
MEPKWVHGKRRVAEPAHLLAANELIDRVCAAFDGDRAFTGDSPRCCLIPH